MGILIPLGDIEPDSFIQLKFGMDPFLWELSKDCLYISKLLIDILCAEAFIKW